MACRVPEPPRRVEVEAVALPDACRTTPDADHDGWHVRQAGGRDCDDEDTAAGDCDPDTGDAPCPPAGVEVCNGVDDDCDGGADNDATDATSWYPDADADGYGDTVAAVVHCGPPGDAFVEVPGDCDDDHAGISPAGSEVCDGLDNDCDASTLDAGVWLEDAGTWTDWTRALGRGKAGSPVAAELSGGNLNVCGGLWFTNITVTGPAVITGYGGREATVLDAGGEGSTVRTDGSGVTLAVADLTIIGGSGSSSEIAGFHGGGGILCDGADGATVVVDNVWMTGGTAYAGGAIFAVDCDVSVMNSTISENVADYGGGILSFGVVASVAVKVEDSTVADNTGTAMGGGLYLQGNGNFDLVNSLVDSNTASTGGGLVLSYGMAGTCRGDSASIAGFHGNSASTAAAVYLYWVADSPVFTATSCDLGDADTAADNAPGEVYAENVATAYSYGEDASFLCSTTGCL